jgi:acetyl-CoA acetyltransferase
MQPALKMGHEACATSAHCIGNALEMIQLGKQDMVFAGGGEELHWALAITHSRNTGSNTGSMVRSAPLEFIGKLVGLFPATFPPSFI